MMNSNRLVAFVAAVLFLTSATAASDETTTLREIMQGLRDSLVEIADGLLTDDFERVARGAHAIANHPHIPANQAQLVAAELGQEMPAFKEMDHRVHHLSLELKAAADALDRESAITAYQRMVDGCFACHDAFKSRIAAVLNEPGR